MPKKIKKVMVSGCFDLLHSGHVQFFKEASAYGDLYVSIGSDANIIHLKNRKPVNTEAERLFMVKSIRYVKDAFVSQEMGVLDFKESIKKIKPDYFIVNTDGDSPAKRELVESLKIQYIVLERLPAKELKARSTTDLRKSIAIPYRIDLAGGWLDQPFVSTHHPGPVITFPIFGIAHEQKRDPFSLEIALDFDHRSGMATSTRKRAIELWGRQINDKEDPLRLAEILFHYDNTPGKKNISGAQDAIGITVPGITYSRYEGQYWPTGIETITDEEIINFLEDKISLIPLHPRDDNFEVLSQTKITKQNAKKLSRFAEETWEAIKRRDAETLGQAVTKAFKAQVSMFPLMISPEIKKVIREHVRRYNDNILGYKLSGAGGGGYVIFITKEPLPDSLGVKIMREILRD